MPHNEDICAGEPMKVNMITLGQQKYPGQILGGRDYLVAQLHMEDI